MCVCVCLWRWKIFFSFCVVVVPATLMKSQVFASLMRQKWVSDAVLRVEQFQYLPNTTGLPPPPFASQPSLVAQSVNYNGSRVEYTKVLETLRAGMFRRKLMGVMG